MKKLVAGLSVVCIVGLPTSTHAQQKLSVAAQLASIDAARVLTEGDPAVTRMKSALHEAKLICKVDSLVTGEQVSTTRKLLAQKM